MPRMKSNELKGASKNTKGTLRDKRGQDQPADKASAQKAGLREQQQSVKDIPENPGEPAGGE